MKYDLHVHTDISDNNLSLAEVVSAAEDRNVDYLAIMDHDTLRAVSAVKIANANTKVNIIGGLEISSYDYKNKNRAHILAYNIKENDTDILKIVNKTITQRNEASYKSVKAINAKGDMKIDLKELKEYEGKTGLYKQHILHYLLDKGYDTELLGKVKKEVFGKDGYARFDITYPDVITVIEAVKKSGGIPVLAHPYIYNNMILFDEMYEAGLTGLEAGHPHNSQEQTEYLINLCKEKNMFITCGSDYHGFYGEVNVELGQFSLDDELIMPFINELRF